MSMKRRSITSELRDVDPDSVNRPASLGDVFRMQRAFVDKVSGAVGKPNWLDLCLVGEASERGFHRTNATRDLVDAMHNELEETREHTPWKGWRRYPDGMYEALGSDMSTEVSELRYELVDMLHFLVELCLVWGMSSADLMRMYGEKMAVNERRQEDGY